MTRIRRWLRYIMLMLALFVIGAVAAFVTMQIVIKGHEAQVPDMAGKDIVSSLARLNELDLRLKIVSKEYNSQIPENHIISHQPSGGALVKTGRDIKVILSKGPELALVPDLSQDSLTAAGLKLTSLGWKPGAVAHVHHSAAPDQVIAQFPPPNTRLAKGKEVNLVVSSGPHPPAYLMPDVVGQTLDSATIKLKSLGLEIGDLRYEVYPGLAKGTVISHSPWPGYRVQAGDTVTLVASK